jgi:hypothetical protein
MLSLVAHIGEGRGSSLVTILLSAGVPTGLARATAFTCAAIVICAAWKLSGQADGDRRAFGLCVTAALLATPVLWAHYLVLLFVPIAILSPELSPMCFLPMLAVLHPLPQAHPTVVANLPVLAIEQVVIGNLCAPLLQRAATASRGLLRRTLRLSFTWLMVGASASGDRGADQVFASQPDRT